MIKTKAKVLSVVSVALFYFGVAMIAASISFGLVLYYYDTEANGERYPEEFEIVTLPQGEEPHRVLIIRPQSRTPKHYQLLVYALSGLGLGLIVTHHLRARRGEGIK